MVRKACPPALCLGFTLAACILATASPPFPPSDLLRGDANHDGLVNSSDPAYVLNYLFYGGSPPPCPDAADANDDGAVNLSDAVYLNAYLFSGGPPPASPFPYCGQDPTSDYLFCSSSQNPACD